MCRVLPILALITIATGKAPCQQVTAEAKVEIDGRVETVRQINGRWWAPDNRQLTPQKDRYIWDIAEKGKTWNFHHHRPVNLQLAESLHLSMSPVSVENLLGPPNETAEHEGTGSRGWMYYAADGTALSLHFMHDELAIAKYDRRDYGVSGKPVQSVARDLSGRDVFKVMADKAWQRNSPAEYAKYRGQNPAGRGPNRGLRALDQGVHAQNEPVRSAKVVVSDSPAPSVPNPPTRRITAELANSVKPGMSRPDVVKMLGEPSGGMHIAGGENNFEVMTYALAPEGQLSLRIENGSVVKISR